MKASAPVLEKRHRKYYLRFTYEEERDNNSKIKEYERLYDSLNEFKGVVSDSKEQFSSVNSRKKEIAASMEIYANECKTGKTYSKGMKKVLNGVGVANYFNTFWELTDEK